MAGKSNLSFIIIIVIILVVDVIGGYYIGKKVMVPYSYEMREDGGDPDNPESQEGPLGSEEPGMPHQLEPINMNPKMSQGEVFSVSITLETVDQLVIDELTSRDPQVIDIILTYLSDKTIPELSDVSVRPQYRKDIVEKINSVLTTGSVTNLYVTQWIIQ